MTVLTILEYNKGRGTEVEILDNFEYAIVYTKKLMKWEKDVPHEEHERSGKGMRVLHLDTQEGESVIYEFELIEQPVTVHKEDNTPRKRKLRIRK